MSVLSVLIPPFCASTSRLTKPLLPAGTAQFASGNFFPQLRIFVMSQLASSRLLAMRGCFPALSHFGLPQRHFPFRVPQHGNTFHRYLPATRTASSSAGLRCGACRSAAIVHPACNLPLPLLTRPSPRKLPPCWG